MKARSFRGILVFFVACFIVCFPFFNNYISAQENLNPNAATFKKAKKEGELISPSETLTLNSPPGTEANMNTATKVAKKETTPSTDSIEVSDKPKKAKQ